MNVFGITKWRSVGTASNACSPPAAVCAFCRSRRRALDSVLRLGNAISTWLSSPAATEHRRLRRTWCRVDLAHLRFHFADCLPCQRSSFVARVSVLWLSESDNSIACGDQTSFTLHSLIFPATPRCCPARIFALFHVLKIPTDQCRLSLIAGT